MRESSSASRKLFEIPDAFAKNQESEEVFLEAMEEILSFHYEHSEFYRSLCRQNSYNPGKLKGEEDLQKIPYVFVDVFKHREFLSVPEEEIVFTFTSSGTGGMKSQIRWDEISMMRQGMMRTRIMNTLGLRGERPARYMIFSYDFGQSRGRGAAYAHEMYSTFAPALEKFYALRKRHPGEDFTFSLEESAEVLERMAKSGDPVRILGFPSFTFFTLEELMVRNETLPLPEESLVINGGGWKLHTGREISKAKYRQETARFFGLTEDRIRDVFGMVEHGVPYITCSEGNFHEPLYSKILVRHPLTGEVLPPGEVGLVQFLTPYITSMPTFSLLSSDLGFLTPSCPCGIKKPHFTILRRGGTSQYKGCALTASELIR